MIDVSQIEGLPDYVKKSPRLMLGLFIIVVALVTYGLLQLKFLSPLPVDINEPPIAGDVKTIIDGVVVTATPQGDRVFEITEETIFKNGTVSDIVPGNKIFAVGKRATNGTLKAYKVYFNTLDE